MLDDWKNGTALFYWFTHPTYGAAEWLQPTVRAVLDYGPVLALTTWSVVTLEFFLGFALFMYRPVRRILMYAAMLMHAGIAVVHGLPTFALTMVAALLLSLGDEDCVESSVRGAKAALNRIGIRLAKSARGWSTRK